MTKRALLIGSLQNNGIINELSINNIKYDVKLLNSSVDNWNTIIKMIDNNYDLIIIKMTESALIRSCNEEYETTFFELFNSLITKEHMILLYEGNMKYDYSYITNEIHLYSTTFYELEELERLEEFEKLKSLLNKRIDYLISEDLNIYTYLYSENIYKLVQDYINDVNDGLIMKFYIPNDRLLSKELSKIIELFESYINSLFEVNIAINKKKTKEGMLVEFYMDNENYEIVKTEWMKFPDMLHVFASDINETRKIIEQSNIQEEQKNELCRILNKDSRRILLDIKFELKKRELELTNLIENHILELENSSALNNEFKIATDLNNSIQLPNKTINVSTVNFTYINEIQGNIVKNENDEKMLKLIYELGKGKERTELIDSFNEVNDGSIKERKKIMPLNKLKKFLMKNSDKIGSTAFKFFMEYIESKMLSG